MRQRLVAWFRGATRRQWAVRLAMGALGGMVLLLALIFLAYSAVSLPSDPPQVETTVIRDAQGSQVAELYKTENRVPVPLDKVSDVMEKAVVAAEDRHFYEHSGIDPIGTARALLNDIRGHNVQGGSTITQQLVKNTYLTSERSIVRKAKEAILAVKVERQFDKREILDRYLNTIYFGRGAYGVEKAAQNYFGKSAAELDLPEAALLAGLIRAPGTADPTARPRDAMARRALVLDAMVRTKVLSKADADAARSAPFDAIPRPDPNQILRGPSAYFSAMVRDWAVKQFGERLAFGGGLQITTTLNGKLQDAADKAITSTLDKPDDPDAALVSMADDGAVLALIGGKDFQESAVNLAMNNKRPQAGSTFKPFVLAAALENDVPVTQRFPGPAKKTIPFAGYPPYQVSNFNNEAFGSIDLTDATAHSVNTVYAQLAADVGLRAIAATAAELGVDTKVPIVPSMSLGSANVSPYEMIRAYMTFANRGKRIDPYFVQKVTDPKGHVLYEAHPSKRSAYDERYADVVNNVLSQVIKKGTGTAASIGKPAAGKTGTTSNNTDAWFVGYTPKIGTAVWMGYRQDTSRKMDRVHGIQVTGGTFPAQIWQRFMKVATQGVDSGDFTPPDPSLMDAPPKSGLHGSVGAAETTTTNPNDASTTTTSPQDATTTTSPSSDGSTTTTSSPRPTTTNTTATTTSTTAKPKTGPP
jgi:penicillin-binding protein 1A